MRARNLLGCYGIRKSREGGRRWAVDGWGPLGSDREEERRVRPTSGARVAARERRGCTSCTLGRVGLAGPRPGKRREGEEWAAGPLRLEFLFPFFSFYF